jgi:prevent-host-death family protein
MPEVNVTELRQRLPYYLKQVEKGMELLITSRGKTIAKIVPEEDAVEAARKRLMSLRGTMITGDIQEPVPDTEWTADADNL